MKSAAKKPSVTASLKLCVEKINNIDSRNKTAECRKFNAEAREIRRRRDNCVCHVNPKEESITLIRFQISPNVEMTIGWLCVLCEKQLTS